MPVCAFCKNDPDSPKASHLFADAPSQPNYDLGDAVQFTLRNSPGLIGIFTTLAAFVRGFIGAWKKPSGAMIVVLALLPFLGACAWSAALGYPWKDIPTIPGPTTTPKPSPSATPVAPPTPSPTASPTPGPASTPTPGPGVCPADVPPLASIEVKVYRLAKYVGDATPRVHDRQWCLAQGREQDNCPFWKDGSEIRLACEKERALPLTWTLNGIPCDAVERGCWPHLEPTKVFAALSSRGTLRACAPGGLICGEASIGE